MGNDIKIFILLVIILYVFYICNAITKQGLN
jgi:hypothetical protein